MPTTAMLPAWANWTADETASFTRTFAAKARFGGLTHSQGTSEHRMMRHDSL